MIFWFLFAVTLLPDVSYFIYLSLRKNSFINQQNLLLTKLCYLHVPLQHLVKCLNFSAGGVCKQALGPDSFLKKFTLYPVVAGRFKTHKQRTEVEAPLLKISKPPPVTSLGYACSNFSFTLTALSLAPKTIFFLPRPHNCNSNFSLGDGALSANRSAIQKNSWVQVSFGTYNALFCRFAGGANRDDLD